MWLQSPSAVYGPALNWRCGFSAAPLCLSVLTGTELAPSCRGDTSCSMFAVSNLDQALLSVLVGRLVLEVVIYREARSWEEASISIAAAGCLTLGASRLPAPTACEGRAGERVFFHSTILL